MPTFKAFDAQAVITKKNHCELHPEAEVSANTRACTSAAIPSNGRGRGSRGWRAVLFGFIPADPTETAFTKAAETT